MFDVEMIEVLMASDGYAYKGDLAKYERLHVTGIAFDSREVDENKVFVPIIGEKVDAHRFIPQVFETGCFASLTSRKDIDYQGDKVLIYVPDTLKAMQKIAAHFRKKIEVPIIGVTGSVGKTTTRQMIAQALSAGKRVYATKGNNNSQIGVPNTIFNFDNDAQIGVLEMGMSMPGEMGRIAGIVRPDTAVFTNIGISHIENLGSREKILEEKMHITDHMEEGGVVYLNHENDLLKNCSLRKGLKAFYYGLSPDCDAYPKDLDLTKGYPEFTAVIGKDEVKVKLSVFGIHSVLNALAALSVSRQYGVDLGDSAEALREFSGFAHRQQLIKAGSVSIIDDTYNASPDSMKAGIDILAGLRPGGRRIAVLADMKELGDETEKAHRKVGSYLKAAGNIDMLVTLGDDSRRIADESGIQNRIHFEDRDSLEGFLLNEIGRGDAVLLKGSNSMGLSHTAELLTKELSL